MLSDGKVPRVQEQAIDQLGASSHCGANYREEQQEHGLEESKDLKCHAQMKNPHYYQTLVEDSTLALNSRVLYLIKITGNVLRSLVHVHTCTRVPLYTMLGTNFQFCYHLCVSPGISLLRLEVHLLSLCSMRGAWQGF